MEEKSKQAKKEIHFRLSPERHKKLSMYSVHTGVKIQKLLEGVIDGYIDSLPEIKLEVQESK